MSGHNDDIKLKLAWQTAFELRTCPDNETLHAPNPDENLSRHLSICHVCRDKREMQQDERDAWKSLKERFATIAMKPGIGTDKQVGQVWTIKREFGNWREDGHFIRTPSVVLLEKIVGTAGWRVAQIFNDKQLMGNGDVSIGERYGFAEAWNCYSMKEDRFDKCLGGVGDKELEQVLATSVTVHAPAPEGSMLSFFRSMEIDVGAFVAVPAVVGLVEEWESASNMLTVNSWLENIFGSTTDVLEMLKHLVIPDGADSLIEFLSGARNPSSSLTLAAADTNITLPINIVYKKSGRELSIETVNANITDDDWQDGTYFVAGKLCEEPPMGLHLVASLTFNGDMISECINQMTAHSLYFDVVFNNVPKNLSRLENVRLLLVHL